MNNEQAYDRSNQQRVEEYLKFVFANLGNAEELSHGLHAGDEFLVNVQTLLALFP
jgi:hypothetical protein